MRVLDLDFTFPDEACAQRPVADREAARLLVAPALGGRGDDDAAELCDDTVANLPRHVRPGDVFVLNDSRVQPARIDALKDSGGRVELLVLERRTGPPETWLAMARASHAPKPGRRLQLPGACTLEILGREGDLFVVGVVSGDLSAALHAHGRPPLPPYIRRSADDDDRSRYQTTFARAPGDEWGSAGTSVAAPTAGLHLTPTLMDRMRDAGASFVRVSLGVGPGTFRPIESDRVEDHLMHDEPLEITHEAARALNQARERGARITAVGTTSLRAVEAAATPDGRVRPVRGATGLYCLPGCRFRVISRLMTNFHRPQSTLLALVAAFAGFERALAIHREGVARGYRLFSYGDATLVERAT